MTLSLVFDQTGKRSKFSESDVIDSWTSNVISSDAIQCIVLNTSVQDAFDMESSHTFSSANSLVSSLNILNGVSEEVQTQVWSVFKAAISKSTRNLIISIEIGLSEILLKRLSTCSVILADLFSEVLCIIVPQSVSICEMKFIINSLQVTNELNHWPVRSNYFLNVLKQTPFQTGPTEFFDFPGLATSAIAIPPISKWPYANGFTFSAWIRSDPVSDISEDKDKPYVYCFRTAKGQGYSAHFVGSCLIITVIKGKSKGYQYSVNYEFKHRTWYMLTLVHIYSRWRAGEIKCYVDGSLITSVEVNWYVKTYDIFDRCFLGSAPPISGDSTADHVARCFCGQMGTVYLLSAALSDIQVEALCLLGPSYTGMFTQQSDADICLNESSRQALFASGFLFSNIVFSYSARASQCQICFFSAAANKDAPSYFSHSPHAQLQGEVKAVTTKPVYHTMHSLGGLQILLPLFSQLSLPPSDQDISETRSSFCETLLDIVIQLLKRSSQMRQQMVQMKGLMVIGHYMGKNSHKVMTDGILDKLIEMATFFTRIKSEALLKHTIDFFLLNASLWIQTPAPIQIRLFRYLATDFAVHCPLFQLSRIRRVSTVLQLLHMLKYYYWVTNPLARSGITPKGIEGNRPDQGDILTIRSLILLFLKVVITIEEDVIDDEHMQSVLNYLTTLHEEENIHDVLSLLLSIISNNPIATSAALDRKYAVRALFKVLNSPSERIRIKTVKVLVFYLASIPVKRKIDIMTSYGLYDLIGQRMMLHLDELTLPTYNVMYEFCTEQVFSQIFEFKHPEADSTTPLMNPLGLKTIANMIGSSRRSNAVLEIKRKFVSDMILLFSHNRDNRRKLLQCTVWQDWVFSVMYIYPSNEKERNLTEMVFMLVKILLHHAIKFEYGGWRVWIDTVSIAHFKVSVENYRRSVLGIGIRPKLISPANSRRPTNQTAMKHTIEDSDEVTASEPKDSPVHEAEVHAPPTESEIEENGVKSVDEEKSNVKNDDQVIGAADELLNEDLAAVEAQAFIDHLLETVGRRITNDANSSLKVLGLPSSSVDEHVGLEESSFAKNDNDSASSSAQKSSLSELQKSVRFAQSTEEEEAASPSNSMHKEVESSSPRSILKNKSEKVFINDSPGSSKEAKRTFRIPPFTWTPLVNRLLSDLLFSIETDVQVWRTQSNKPLLEFLNSPDNLVFLHNTVHVISQLSDMIVYSSGGILPLLSSATSQNNENIQATDGLTFDQGFIFIHRLLNLVDVFVFSGNVNFPSLETEKRMNPGGIIRQCLRLSCWASLRNSLEVRHKFARQLMTFNTDAAGDFSELLSPNFDIKSQYHAITDISRILQDMDVSRLRATVYREVEDPKQSQFLALATVYFLTILMVGRYRDILEPDKVPVSPFKLQNTSAVQPTTSVMQHQDAESDEDHDSNALPVKHAASRSAPDQVNDFEDIDLGTPSIDSQDEESLVINAATDETISANASSDVKIEKGKKASLKRSSTWSGDDQAEPTPVPTESTEDLGLGIRRELDLKNVSTNKDLKSDALTEINFSAGVFSKMRTGDNISKHLENSLEVCSVLLREIFLDFSSFLSKTLIGSHGQELLLEGLNVMKSSESVIEQVMMLCSQEWQNSLQKYAGVGFLNLVNEGRLIAAATSDHLIRVAHEANEIINREYQELMQKHSEFEARCATHLAERRTEENMCDRLIVAARRRDMIASVKCIQKVMSSSESQSVWIQQVSSDRKTYYKQDIWEDNLRRRRRFIVNTHGTSHTDATLKAAIESGASEDAISEVKKMLEQQLPSSSTGTLVAETDDISLDETEDNTSALFSLPATNYPVKFQTHDCYLVHPCIVTRGTLSITSSELIFDVDEEESSFKSVDPSLLAYCEYLHVKLNLSDVKAVFSRRYLLQNTALEIFLASRSAIMFNFTGTEAVKEVINALPRVGIGTKYGAQQTRRHSLANGKQLFRLTNMTERWQRREISNFQYLMFVNTVAGRTYNDLNQYPVFPWVLTDFESPELDLSSPNIYRDLTKPIGALDARRAGHFKVRFESWESDSIPPFHYGTHYSTSGFVLNWLIRQEPYTSLFLNFQGGKFDHPDRTFHSIPQTWQNCQGDSADVKELIPELFYLPEMFHNRNALNFGKMESGVMVDDVKLPNWAKTPEEFIRLHRMALESEHVSAHLHHWIDLIFGFKQRGPEAVKAVNVFYYLTYEGAVNLASIQDPVLLDALKSQIRSFGTTPCQLMAEAHPQRSSSIVLNPQLFKQIGESDGFTVKLASNSPVVCIAANNFVGIPNAAIVTIAENHSVSINKWLHDRPVLPLMKEKMQSTGSSGEPEVFRPLQLDTVQQNPSVNFTGRKLHTDLMDIDYVCTNNTFSVSSDNLFAFVVGFWDRSLRVFQLESGKLNQVVFGHYGVVTCVTRTECKTGSDCFVITGSADNTVLVWYWTSRYQCIVGEKTIPGEYPMAKAILMGHCSEIKCVAASSELGIVVSASIPSNILVHTLFGDFVRKFDVTASNGPLGSLHLNSVSGYVTTVQRKQVVSVLTLDGVEVCDKEFSMDKSIHDVTTSFDGSYILIGGDGIEVLRSHTLETLHRYQSSSIVRSLQLTQDNKNVVAGLSNGSILVNPINFIRWHPEFHFDSAPSTPIAKSPAAAVVSEEPE